jgi:hypothetical protein
MRLVLAVLGTPLLAPAVMYGATYVFALSFGGDLSFSLASYYRVGLPYAYGIFVLVGVPLFALLLTKRIHSVIAFIALGAAIFPILFGLILGYDALRDEQLSVSGSEGGFIVSAILTGAVLGAVFWLVAVAGRHEKAQSNI